MCDNRNIRRRAERVTDLQKQILIEFMKDHGDFARGKLLGLEGKVTSNNLWKILCQQLNSNGPVKSVVKWQRVWTDIKIKVKRKASGIFNRRQKTGEPPDDITLDEFDDKVVEIMTEIAVYGLSSSDNDPLNTEDPMRDVLPWEPKIEPLLEPVLSCSNNAVSPCKKRGSQWAHIVNEEERKTVPQCGADDFDCLSSPRCSEKSSSSATTSQRTCKRRCVAAQAADELQELSRQSTQALEEVGTQLQCLNEKLDIIISQNSKMEEERINTNNILTRIAMALEDRTII